MKTKFSHLTFCYASIALQWSALLFSQSPAEPSPAVMMEVPAAQFIAEEMIDDVLGIASENSKAADISVTAPVIRNQNELQNQVSSTVDDCLNEALYSNILTTAKANVAVEQSAKTDQVVNNFKKLQKAERRQKRQAQIHASSAISETEGYATPGAFLKNAILKNVQAEVASSLLQGSTLLPGNRKLSAAERDVEDFTTIAEKKRTQARELSFDVLMVQKKAMAASVNNFDQEIASYTDAEEAWDNTVRAYQLALKKAAKASIDTKDLTTACDEAIAHKIYWSSRILEVNARKSEQALPVIQIISPYQAEVVESAWDQVCQSYREAITKAETVALTDEADEWSAVLSDAVAKKTFWTTHIISLEKQQQAVAKAHLIKAQQLTAQAIEVATRASNGPDTIEAINWKMALEKGADAITAWEAASKNYKGNSHQALERFKNSWSNESQQLVADQAALAARISSWKTEQTESIVRARTLVEEARRSEVVELQVKAQKDSTVAEENELSATRAADTIEAAHWARAIEAANRAKASWDQVVKNCTNSETQSLQQPQEWWQNKQQEIKNNPTNWSKRIAFLESQKAESISRAKKIAEEILRKEAAIVRAEQEAIQKREQEIQRKQQEEIRAQRAADDAKEKAAQQRLQEEERVASMGKVNEAISLQEALIERLQKILNQVNIDLQDALVRAKRQEYSFRNFVGISHSKRDALEDELSATAAAKELDLLIGRAKEDLKAVRGCITRVVGTPLEAFLKTTYARQKFQQAQGQLISVNQKLPRLEQETAEADRVVYGYFLFTDQAKEDYWKSGQRITTPSWIAARSARAVRDMMLAKNIAAQAESDCWKQVLGFCEVVTGITRAVIPEQKPWPKYNKYLDRLSDYCTQRSFELRDEYWKKALEAQRAGNVLLAIEEAIISSIYEQGGAYFLQANKDLEKYEEIKGEKTQWAYWKQNCSKYWHGAGACVGSTAGSLVQKRINLTGQFEEMGKRILESMTPLGQFRYADFGSSSFIREYEKLSALLPGNKKK